MLHVLIILGVTSFTAVQSQYVNNVTIFCVHTAAMHDAASSSHDTSSRNPLTIIQGYSGRPLGPGGPILGADQL